MDISCKMDNIIIKHIIQLKKGMHTKNITNITISRYSKQYERQIVFKIQMHTNNKVRLQHISPHKS